VFALTEKFTVAVHHLQDGWNPDKNSILVITKARDNKLVTFTQQLAEWLIFTPRFGKKNPFVVYVLSTYCIASINRVLTKAFQFVVMLMRI
jgi:hypothetical protein